MEKSLINSGEQRIFIAISGASGALYSQKLIEELIPKVSRIYLCMTKTAKKVIQHELHSNTSLNFSLKTILNKGPQKNIEKKVLRIFEEDNFFAPIASGTSAPTTMVILPCSMGTLARIRSGISSNLIERAADVCLKQKKNLIICPRESPLNTIHLENLLKLSQIGAQIIPCMPGFYHKPKNLDDVISFMVGRILESLDLNHNLYPPWNQKML